MKTFKTPAIILHTQNIFEKDRLIEAFTPEHGKIRFLAKYANTKKFKYGGKLSLTNIIDLTLFRGKTFYLLSDCSLQFHFPNMRTAFNKITLASYFIQIIRNASSEGQPNPLFYSLLASSLMAIERQEDTAKIKTEFEKEFLDIEGLLHEKETICPYTFKRKYEDYVGRELKPMFSI